MNTIACPYPWCDHHDQNRPADPQHRGHIATFPAGPGHIDVDVIDPDTRPYLQLAHHFGDDLGIAYLSADRARDLAEMLAALPSADIIRFALALVAGAERIDEQTEAGR